MEIRWTKLPFPARNQEEFNHKLTEWLSWVFYDELPAKGYEVREEQIYTAFRMAKALGAGGTPLMAEAGPGTGKTFAYLLPAVCYARLKGAPVVVASATPVLQAQLMNPEGDIRTLSRILGLDIDARGAADPSDYICEMKIGRLDYLFEEAPEGWDELKRWAEMTGTGARTEVPEVTDELWGRLAWDPSLPCDTCTKRGHCHVMMARRHYRAAPDLVVCDHRLFSRDLLTRAERLEVGEMPLLPAYSAVVFDEGHHVPEIWQKAQGHSLSWVRMENTLDKVEDLTDRENATKALAQARRMAHRFFKALEAATEPGEGKRHIKRTPELADATQKFDRGLEILQDELVTEEAMSQGLDIELHLRAYQARLDDVRAALRLFESEKVVSWVEGHDLWAVPRKPVSLYGKTRLAKSTPVIFSSATLEPEYQARILQLPDVKSSRAGVPFDLAEQALVYHPGQEGDAIAQTVDVLRATNGRGLVLLNSLAEVRRYKAALEPMALPWTVMYEGDGERGAQLDRFRNDIHSVLVGATFWEGVDVPGEALSCCVIPRLPFPEHDPLIMERRRQAEADGEDPFDAVDVPEMLIKLKQGAGRLIRSAKDRGVLAVLDRSYLGEGWEEAVEQTLPEDAERTSDLSVAARFVGVELHQAK